MTDITLTAAGLASPSFWAGLNVSPGSRLFLGGLPSSYSVTVTASAMRFRNAATGQNWTITSTDLGAGTPDNISQIFAQDGDMTLDRRAQVANPPPARRTAWAGPAPEPALQIACFTRGTPILTPEGEVAVDLLTPGDLVETMDHGPQPIRAIGRRRMPGGGATAPIRFVTGAIGNRDTLLVSPQHRVLLRGWRAELMFGEAEVLAAAVDLVNDSTVRRSPMAEVDYLHLVFDRHEIVSSLGALTESFNPALDGDCRRAAARDELQRLMPELGAMLGAGVDGPARRVLDPHEALALIA